MNAPLDPAVPPWPHRHETVNGCRVMTIDVGPREPQLRSRTFVLLHGGHGGWMHWRQNIEALSRRHRVVVPDMPGFGLSEDLPAPGIEAVAATLSALLDRVRAHGATLVGYSFGSLAASALAARRPDSVWRLMLVNPPGWGERSPETTRLYAEASDVAKRDGLRAGLAYTLSHVMLKDPAGIDDACLDANEACTRNLRFYTRDISRSADLPALLRAVSQPLHVVFGAEDPGHQYRLAERRALLREWRGAPCSTAVANARHWVQHEHPRTFESLLLRFASGETLPATA